MKKDQKFSAVQFMRKYMQDQQAKKTPVGKPKAKKRLSPMSPKRKKESVEYSKLRKEFLESNPQCQVRGCSRRSRDVHHKEKRGANYLKVDTWMAVCRQCHDKIELNKSWAREQQYLK